MRVCSSCGRENPDDRDFCECGEYLRWDPTGVVQAVTPEVLQAAQDQAPPPAAEPPAAPAAAGPARRRRAGAAAAAARAACPPGSPPGRAAGARQPRQRRRRPARPCARRSRLPRRRPRPPSRRRPLPPRRRRRRSSSPSRRPRPPPPAQPAEPDPAAISLRLPEGDQGQPGETVTLGVEPGGRNRVLALVRNQSGDRRQLRAVSARTAGRLVVDLPQHRVPRAVRHQRHVRAGGGDPPPPAAHARGRGADLGARGRRPVEGLQPAGRRGAAEARDPPVRGVQDQARARARVRPQEGATSTSRSTTRPTAR